MMKRLLRWLGFGLLGVVGAIALSGIGSLGLPLQGQPTPLPSNGDVNDARVVGIEQTWQTDYHRYFDLPLAELPMNAADIRQVLGQFNQEQDSEFALLYVFPHPDELELVLLAPRHETRQIVLSEVSQDLLDETLQAFQQDIVVPARSGRDLTAAQQLYRWIVAPVKDQLDQWSVDTLLLCVGPGIRSTPLAALHDGQRFLVESYNISIIPAFSLIDQQREVGDRPRLLAMGASEFESLESLPAVPVELGEIEQQQWLSQVFLNADFTRENLMQQLATEQFSIVHLATHAAFKSGTPDQSYIQLWQNDRITLDDMRDLGWRDRPIDLLVLSACETALGDRQAEMGFAGLSFQSGVRTTLASLWQVSDVGTLALMREFYWQFAQPDVTTKAEALNRTQLALLRGEVYVDDGFLYCSGDPLILPDTLAQQHVEFTSPYDWAGFTLVGSPW